jgi:hypothetical protein
MGRYLDLVQARSDAAKIETHEYDRNDRNDQRGLRSYMSFLSYSGTRSFDDATGMPTEPKPQDPQSLSDGTTETTEVDIIPAAGSATPEYALAEGQVISPARWAESAIASDGPSFDEPCPERRGLVERRGAVFLHFCVECGRWGAYGYGATRTRPGRWYCRLHRPSEQAPSEALSGRE